MKNLNFFFVMLVSLSVLSTDIQAQCSGGRYHDMVFPGNPVVTSDIVYGSNRNWQNNVVDLKLDVYRPACDNATDRALIVFAHGGSFMTGDKADASYAQTAIALAKLGYVVASINYRLGFPTSGLDAAYGFNSAIMRGLHDGRAAVRFMRNNALNGGNTYGIDPNKIFFGGVSAGGIIALHLAYQNQSGEMNMNCGGQPGTDQSSIEGNSNNLNVSSAVTAIVSIAGGIRDLNWITNNDVPAGLFHGDQDQTVPYGSGTFGGFFTVHGSSSIATRCNTTTTKHCFKTMYGQDHVPSNPAYVDTISTIMRNFLEHFTCNTTLACNYTATPVPVNPSVSIAVTAGSNSICEGESVTFTATALNTVSPAYQWKINGNNAGTGNTFTSANFNNGDVVTCTITPSCGSPANSLGITMNVTAKPTISESGYVLTSSATTGNQWYVDGQIINGANGQTYTATHDGDYTVKVNGCESDGVNVLFTSSEMLSNIQTLNVFPNPNAGHFNIVFNSSAEEKYQLEIINTVGSVVYRQEIKKISGAYSEAVDITSMGTGLYFVRIKTEELELVRKVAVY